MSRPSKGAHLWWREPRINRTNGKLVAIGQWFIIDGRKHVGTGRAKDEKDEADRDLAQYIIDRYQAPRRARDIEDIPLAEVLSIYDADCRDKQANQRTYDARILRLNDWWGTKKLADVNGQTCREYVAARGKRGGARRDLEDLRAAINYHEKEGLHRGNVRVALPEKGPARDRYLTRSEAARLVWACWRYRETQKRARGPSKGKPLPTKKKPLQHVARFILLGLYTGTRAAAIASASPYRDDGHSWVDLDAGVFYRLAEGKKATNKRQPPVKLPSNLLSHLRRWKRSTITTGHFIEYNGAPVKSVKTGFAHGVKLAKLEGDITPHTLRHTAATWLVQNGSDLPGAAELLGMSIQMLERTYWHHHPDFQRLAASSFRPKRASNEIPKKLRNENGTDANEQAPVETLNA